MIGIITGTFDENNGKQSYFGNEIYDCFNDNRDILFINGGNYSELLEINFSIFDTLIWMPNVSNDYEKILPKIKQINKKLLLVSSKRVIEKEYTESDIVGRLLKTKSNLGIMITKDDNYNFKLIDPLGNIYYDGNSIIDMTTTLKNRIQFIKSLNRVGSNQIGDKKEFNINVDFLDFIKHSANEFTKYVNAINPNRMLGNASTRCSYGFPSERQNDRIFVTMRNIDKRLLTNDGFVEVELSDDSVNYYGENKPSVDTHIQLKLFEYYKNINFIVHGHVYLDDCLTTDTNIPCGYIEEFDEVINKVPDKNINYFTINLLGHGCLLFADSVENLWKMDKYISRPFPEKIK